MIKLDFWQKVADNWIKDDDGIDVPDDKNVEANKAREIKDEDLVMFNDISNNEIKDILSDLGFDDI